MESVGYSETKHLERWVVDHPEVLGEDLKIVTTQYNSWQSTLDAASERPDILALSTSGELVVIELKRGSDRRVHLQGITYAALAAGFTRETLSQAHADWLNKRGEDADAEVALESLTTHVEGEWHERMLTFPRLLLVAEEFPAQVLTTVQWLAQAAPQLTIECHEYHLFQQQDHLVASFQRLFPVDDLEDRRLMPSIAAASEMQNEFSSNKRRAKSVTVIFENDLIPAGAKVTLENAGYVRPEIVEKVEAWMAAEPSRADVTWQPHRSSPLVWAEEPDRQWTPSALRDEIFRRADVQPATSSAADAWVVNGMNLYSIADQASQID